MMPPHKEPKDGDGDAGKGNEFIPEYFFTGETRYQLADHAHSGQDHDINRGMRIEPE